MKMKTKTETKPPLAAATTETGQDTEIQSKKN
jgi:hypothetical protein